MSAFARRIMEAKYAIKNSRNEPIETWSDISGRVVGSVCAPSIAGRYSSELSRVCREFITSRRFIPGGRYLYASGRPIHQVNNCFLYRAEDTREGWSHLLRKVSSALMLGGGVGIDYSALREAGASVKRTGGQASGPISLMEIINEVGRHVMQGGSRRSAIWAGLVWDHPDIFSFINIKNWDKGVKLLKEKNFSFPATLDMTNISVILDKRFFKAFDNEKDSKHSLAQKVYYDTCAQMFETSEPGFSINFEDSLESLRNACTEITSRDDSDVCNLGSINLARIYSDGEFEGVVRAAIRFLICGSLYSDIPHIEVERTRTNNRRIGLGLMGIHEWFLQRGLKYGEPSGDFLRLLELYRTVSMEEAKIFSGYLGITTPIKTRAIAPTGTIGIIGETTTGIEPVFCSAFKRRYLKGKNSWSYEYVVDPTVSNLVRNGVLQPENIEDALSLSETLGGFHRRLRFQSLVQFFVDHSISSTINLPCWNSSINSNSNVKERADILYKYLPGLRGITCYADGSRAGQPLTRVDFKEALSKVGRVHEESVDVCDITGAGTCGI